MGSLLTRKITVNMYMTLDGYGEFPKYPGSDVPPKEPREGFRDMWINRYDSVDTILFGRRSYEGHLAVHSESARKPSDPEYMFEFSRFLDRSKKIVLSHYLKKAEWQNTRIMKGDLGRIVARLRREPGKDIIVDAGHLWTREEPLLGSDAEAADSEASVGQEPQSWRAGVALRNGSIFAVFQEGLILSVLTARNSQFCKRRFVSKP